MSNGISPTDFGFTDQRQELSIGLYDYKARFYDPYLRRFISPDPIIPGVGNPQVLDYYSYVMNNPLRFHDPAGNFCWGQPGCAVVGAVIIIAEGLDPFPLDIAAVPLGASMMVSDPAFQNFMTIYGPQLPAYMDFIYQAAQQADAAGQQGRPYADKGGDAGNADPGNSFDPNNFDPDKNPDLVRSLRQTLKNFEIGHKCEVCARKVYDKFAEAGYNPSIERFDFSESGARYMRLNDGTLVSWTRSRSSPAYHEFVRVGNRVFDSISYKYGGPQGMLWDDYLKLWEEGALDLITHTVVK